MLPTVRHVCMMFGRWFILLEQILLKTLATFRSFGAWCWESCCNFGRWFSNLRLCTVGLFTPKSKSEEDKLYCEYGSLETSKDEMSHQRNVNTQYPVSRRQQDDDMPNLNFYLGRRASCPDGIYIDEFHDKWFGDYSRLERVHTFIQWLFPLQEPGMNSRAIVLTKEEIQAFCENETAKDNLLKSYKLMLDFYGIELSNELTGAVKRARNWPERFRNLDRNTHNNLRITRILKCLGDLGYEHYQAPLVHFFLEETLVHSQLPNVKESVLNYFMFTVLNRQQSRILTKYANDQLYHRSGSQWLPRKSQNMDDYMECNTRHRGFTQVQTENKGDIKNARRQPHVGTYSDDELDFPNRKTELPFENSPDCNRGQRGNTTGNYSYFSQDIVFGSQEIMGDPNRQNPEGTMNTNEKPSAPPKTGRRSGQRTSKRGRMNR